MKKLLLIVGLLAVVVAGRVLMGEDRFAVGVVVQAQEPAETDLVAIARAARKFYITDTKAFPREPLEKKLFQQSEFKTGALIIVSSVGDADVVIQLDRVRRRWMWDFTYVMIHRETGFKLGAGKVIAWDGVRAAPGIARQISKRLRQLRGKPKKKQR